MMKIAGIDYSLTSPAICVWKETNVNRHFNFSVCDVHYLETAQRLRRPPIFGLLKNLYPEIYPEWKTEEQRHDLLSEWAMRCTQDCVVFIEGYAFATSGKSHVRSVAENSGLLKHKMHKIKQPFSSIPPHLYGTPMNIQIIFQSVFLQMCSLLFGLVYDSILPQCCL